MQNKKGYKFTPLALKDIEEALEYISVDLDNPVAASALFDDIVKSIDNICCFPYAYPDCSVYMISDEDVRHIRISNYILFYEITKTDIHILRFRYHKMDFTKLNT